MAQLLVTPPPCSRPSATLAHSDRRRPAGPARCPAAAAEAGGHCRRRRELARRRAGGAPCRAVRSAADGSQLHRRHDVGPRRASTCSPAPGARRLAAGGRHDRLGLGRSRGRGDAARRARLRAEAVGQRARCVATLRSEIEAGRANAVERRSTNGASSTRRAASSASCCPRPCRRSTAASSPSRGSRRPASAATASTRSAFGPHAPRALDRRRRRQGHSRGAADVEPAGGGARVRDRGGASRAELCHQVNRILCGHIAEGRFISFFYCVARHRRSASLTYANAGHYPPIARPRRRHASSDSTSGGPVLGVLRRRDLRAGARRRSAPATGSCSSPTASPRRATTTDEEFGEERLLDARGRHTGPAARRRSRRGWRTPSPRSPAARSRTTRR